MPLYGKNLFGVNKLHANAYNNVVEEITVSERKEKSSYITYLYNVLSAHVIRFGGRSELLLGDRSALIIRFSRDGSQIRTLVRDKVTEVIGIGYKYEYLTSRLNVALSKRERKLLCSALIAADLEGDRAYIRRKLEKAEEYSIDGFYHFRLAPLREKWDRILSYIPDSFTSSDLKKFCEFLVGESKNKIYIKGNTVFGENFTPLKRSRLTGEEDTEIEIMLSDAGFVYCLGQVEDSVGDFLQKYYAERAIFS